MLGQQTFHVDLQAGISSGQELNSSGARCAWGRMDLARSGAERTHDPGFPDVKAGGAILAGVESRLRAVGRNNA